METPNNREIKLSEMDNIKADFVEEEDDSVKQRLIAFLRHEHISQGAFERRCKLSNGYVNNIQKSITTPKMKQIIEQFPDLNADWISLGRGTMLLSESQTEKLETIIDNEISRLKSVVIKLQEEKIELYNLCLNTMEDKEVVRRENESLKKENEFLIRENEILKQKKGD